MALSKDICSALSYTDRLLNAHISRYMFFGSASHHICSADYKYDPDFAAEHLARVIMSRLPWPADTTRKLFATEMSSFLCRISLSSRLFSIAISHRSLFPLVFRSFRPAHLTPVSCRVRTYSPASLSLSQFSWPLCLVQRDSLSVMARTVTLVQLVSQSPGLKVPSNWLSTAHHKLVEQEKKERPRLQRQLPLCSTPYAPGLLSSFSTAK